MTIDELIEKEMLHFERNKDEYIEQKTMWAYLTYAGGKQITDMMELAYSLGLRDGRLKRGRKDVS